MSIRQHFTCTVPGCSEKHVARGYCKFHYHRNGPFEPKPSWTPARDFFENVALPYEGDDCLLWPFARSNTGYGTMRLDGRQNSVSRYAALRTYGEPPFRSYEAAHSCGNGHLGCVNPRHLRWATKKENAADKVEHGTQPIGENSHSAKLKEADVREIYALKGVHSKQSLAGRFGVSESQIYYIQSGRAWRSLGLTDGGENVR